MLVLVVDFSDQSHLTRVDTTLETIPVTIPAFLYENTRSVIKKQMTNLKQETENVREM